MEYALIKSGTVQNVIVADEAFIASIASEWEHIERIDTPAERALGVCIGWAWDGSNFVAPPAPPAPPPEPPKPYATFIDIGPFFDRFKELKMSLLTSSDIGVQALIKDIQIRKWINLELPELAQALQYVGTVIPTLTSNKILEILTTPVEPEENLALRKLYFS